MAQHSSDFLLILQACPVYRNCMQISPTWLQAYIQLTAKLVDALSKHTHAYTHSHMSIHIHMHIHTHT